MKDILRCQCGGYTMREQCACSGQAVTTRPPRYSPDKWAAYRRKARRAELEQKGLL